MHLTLITSTTIKGNIMKRAMRFIHPGELLREEVINANELTVTEAAKLLGISRQTLNHIVNLKSDITPDMAFRIAKVFGGTADIWANLQTKYNLHLASIRAKELNLKPYHFQQTA